MPQDDIALPGASAGLPYRLGADLCHTPEELATALTKHWDAGRTDLMSGQITAWAREELQDQDLVRFLQSLLDLRDIKEDLRLLRLLLFLAPTLTPAWRGDTLALPGILAQAAKAVQGDLPAADWIASVFAQQALRELPPAQYPAEVALAARWEEQHAHCQQLWQETTHARTNLRIEQTSIQGVTDFDALVYGEPAGLGKPSAFKLLPMLLLALADASYASHLREQIRSRADRWLAHNPWLEHLLATGEPAAWVIANFLLPYARDETVAVQKRLQLRAREAAARQVELLERANKALAELREACATLGLFVGRAKHARAANACAQLLALVAAARALDVSPHTPQMRTLRRSESVALHIQKQLDAWIHAKPVSALLGTVELRKAIRDLGRTLPTRVPTA